jgi:two-component system, OmpR family, alkaline phosphatase synthesis response regulator PhoP
VSDILLVDDEPTIIEALEKFLSKEGFTTHTAPDANAARLVLSSQKIDLAIIDVLMPKMTGIDLAKEIRQNPKTKDLKIIFLTVVEKAGGEIRKVLSDVKPVEWLQKPVDAGTLREVVNKALGVKRE